jgi:hypothetical protein
MMIQTSVNAIPKAITVCAVCVMLMFSAAHAETTAPPQNLKEKTMQQIRGSFNVQLQAQPAAEAIASAALGRRTIVKQFHGELDAASPGEMLSVHTAVKGSAAYVALERVSGTLSGKRGSFVLMHTGLMDKGQSSLTVQVVPDSATEELQGLAEPCRLRFAKASTFTCLIISCHKRS